MGEEETQDEDDDEDDERRMATNTWKGIKNNNIMHQYLSLGI